MSEELWVDMAPELRIDMRAEASASFRNVSGMGLPDWENVARPHGDISRAGILKMDSPGRGACTVDPKLFVAGAPWGLMVRPPGAPWAPWGP